MQWLPLLDSQCIQYIPSSEIPGSQLTVVGWTMMLGVIIPIIVTLTPSPIVPELFLVTFISHKPTIHVNGFSRLGVQIFGYKTMSGCVVRLDRRGRLGMAHLLK